MRLRARWLKIVGSQVGASLTLLYSALFFGTLDQLVSSKGILCDHLCIWIGYIFLYVQSHAALNTVGN